MTKPIDQKIDELTQLVETAFTGLAADRLQRSDLKLLRRVHDLEERVYGAGRSAHPKHLPL